MWFRNFQFYQFTDQFSFSEQAFAEKLEAFRFKGCDRQAMEAVGWVSPLHRSEQELIYTANGCYLFCMRREQKVIPPSTINESLEERIAVIEQEQGRKVFRKEKQQFKEDIVATLMPKAFTRSTHTHAYIDTRNKFMVINAGSASIADTVISLLIDTLGVLGAAKLTGNTNPAAIMNEWIVKGLPDQLKLSGDYELKDPLDARVAKFKDNEAENFVIRDLLNDGYFVSKIGVWMQEQLKCIITDDLQIKSVKFGEELLNQNDELNIEDKRAKFDADFVLMTSTIADFHKLLLAEFDI